MGTKHNLELGLFLPLFQDLNTATTYHYLELGS
jgi:hypothetical protein